MEKIGHGVHEDAPRLPPLRPYRERFSIEPDLCAHAEGTAADFHQARSQFEAAWPNYTDADFVDYRRARAWTAWKQTMWVTGCKLATQTHEGRSRCLCGAVIEIASMDGHVTAAHMTETADV
jgi:hypothetical protein